jgi:hypothetical protein
LRLGFENIGTRGLAVLAIAGVGAIGLAVHGYGHGISASTAALGSAPVATSNKSSSGSGSQTTTSSSPAAPKSTGNGSTTTTTVKLGPVLSSTQYASMAYKLYPGPVSAKAKLAMAGFNVKVTPSGNQAVVSVSLATSSAAPQTSTIQKGDSVYFIDATLGDDSGNADYSGGDDGLVVTNPQGRIIE